MLIPFQLLHQTHLYSRCYQYDWLMFLYIWIFLCFKYVTMRSTGVTPCYPNTNMPACQKKLNFHSSPHRLVNVFTPARPPPPYLFISFSCIDHASLSGFSAASSNYWKVSPLICKYCSYGSSMYLLTRSGNFFAFLVCGR